MIKKLAFITSVIFLMVFCQRTGVNEKKKFSFDRKTVHKIAISNYCGPLDSCTLYNYQLDSNIVKEAIVQLTNATHEEKCQLSEVDYLLYVSFKDSTENRYELKRGIIKDEHNRCFELADSDYFEEIWKDFFEKVKK